MPDIEVLSQNRLTKQPEEERGFRFDFSGHDEISKDGESISSVVSLVSDIPGTLVYDNGTVVDYDEDGQNESVVVETEAGTAGDVYILECLVLTNSGHKLKLQGLLEIID